MSGIYCCDIKIMAHPKRRRHVEEMCLELGLDIDSDVVFDDRDGGGDAMYTARRAWGLPFTSDNVTHRLVLQDDVATAKFFRSALQLFVNTHPNEFFTLYCPRADLSKCRQGYIEVRGCGVWGQAVVMPRREIGMVFDWIDEVSPGFPHDDIAIGEYARHHGIKVLTTCPNIVQHLAPTSSLLGFNNPKKTSKACDVGDARAYRWDVPAGEMQSIYASNQPQLPGGQHDRGGADLRGVPRPT